MNKDNVHGITKNFYGIPYMIGALFIALVGSLLADRVVMLQNIFICTSLATIYYVMWRYFKYKNVVKELLNGFFLVVGVTASYGLIMLCCLSWLDVAQHHGFFNFNWSVVALFTVSLCFFIIQYLFAAKKFLMKFPLIKFNVIAIINVLIIAFIFAFIALRSGQEIKLEFISSDNHLTVYWYFISCSVVAIPATIALLMFRRPLVEIVNNAAKKQSLLIKTVMISLTVIFWLTIPFVSYCLIA